MLYEDRVLNISSKHALRQMHEEISLGATHDHVVRTYERLKTDRTTIDCEVLRNTCTIGMPLEFGSSDWMLYVQFADDRTVSCVAMRTSDGAHFKPRSLPNDKGTFVPLQKTKE